MAVIETLLWAGSWLLLTGGGALVLIGGVGAVRMPELYTRIHAASVTDSLGTILVIAGLMLQTGLTLELVKLFAILIFMLITAPTAAYALANSAFTAGLQPDPAPSTGTRDGER
jgi:multicomponent Na+:H+ antiporter subunit G